MPPTCKKIVKNHEILKLMGKVNFANPACTFRTWFVVKLENRNTSLAGQE